jgi:hypothetical protein
MPEKKLNYVYSLLVPKKIHDEVSGEVTQDAFIGFIAYCLYKHKKVQWIENYKKDKGLAEDERVPDDETNRWQKHEAQHHIRDYQELARTRFIQIVSGYKKQEINAFKEEHKRISDQRFEIVQRDFKAHFVEEKIRETIELTVLQSQPRSFWERSGKPIVHSAVGAIVFALLTIIFWFYWMGFDMITQLHELLKK